ncbi:MAG: response regulator transcription factor [Streptococcaceae bacterium]|jgi:DNA-binding response OmpR family regulator|nr:response regulator transcription factor [Streptococcaceae bacterium]
MQKILIVEDDPTIAQTLSSHLNTWGFETKTIDDFQKVMEIYTGFQPHLVLMDVLLPFYNGYHWVGEIRKVSKVPVIFLSSQNDNMNVVMAMNMGGDDFIAKPFDLTVLVAKIQAMIRRTYDYQGQVNVLMHKGAILNLNDLTLVYDLQTIDLTKNEFRILQTLMEHTGQAVSRQRIMEVLWQTENFIDDNTLTVNVTRLRRKLEEAGLVDFISTKKGVGYVIN